MLETITPDEVDLNGKALVVTYHPDPQQSELLRIDVAAHAIEAEASFIRMSELRLVVIRELMTRDAMHARVVAKAAKRGIEASPGSRSSGPTLTGPHSMLADRDCPAAIKLSGRIASIVTLQGMLLT